MDDVDCSKNLEACRSSVGSTAVDVCSLFGVEGITSNVLLMSFCEGHDSELVTGGVIAIELERLVRSILPDEMTTE